MTYLDIHTDPPPDPADTEVKPDPMGEIVQVFQFMGRQIGKSLHESFAPVIKEASANYHNIAKVVEQGLSELAPVMENLHANLDHVHYAQTHSDMTKPHNCSRPQCVTSKRYPGVVEVGKQKRKRNLPVSR